MSKNGWIILVICLCLVLCLIAGIRLARRIANAIFTRTEDSHVDSSTIKNYKDLKNTYAADGVYTVQVNDLKELDIDWISGSVLIVSTDEDCIRIRETAAKAISEKDALRFGVSGGTLRIQACRKGYTGNLPKKDLVVSLPRAIVAGLKEVEVGTVSAAVTSDVAFDLEELEIDSVSGKIALSGVKAAEAQVDTVSGTLVLSGCTFASLRMDSVSGQMNAEGVANKVKVSSVSGTLALTLDGCDEVKASTVSGPVILTLSATPRKLEVDTTSGETRLTLPQDASCTVLLDSMSGKLFLNGEAVGAKQVTLGAGEAAFDIDSMSGSVFLYTK